MHSLIIEAENLIATSPKAGPSNEPPLHRQKKSMPFSWIWKNRTLIEIKLYSF